MKKQIALISALALCGLSLTGFTSFADEYEIEEPTMPTEEVTEPGDYRFPDSCWITLWEMPDKTEYELGEQLDLGGAYVYAGYAVNSSYLLESFEGYVTDYLDKLIIDDSAFDSSHAGTYPISITYGVEGHKETDTVTFEVTVKDDNEIDETIEELTEKVLEPGSPDFPDSCGAYLYELPTKTEYKLGEQLDLEGAYIFAEYAKNSSLLLEQIEGYVTDYLDKLTIDDSAFDSTHAGTYPIGIIYGIEGLKETATVTFEVTVKEEIALYGDLNFDREVQLTDLIQMQKYLLHSGVLTREQWLAGDMNQDGKVNIFDLCLLKKILLA